MTLLPNLAGSLPNDAFADILGPPTLWVPHSYPACSQLAPNEHLLASVAREGLLMMPGLFWDLGGPEGAPWKAVWVRCKAIDRFRWGRRLSSGALRPASPP